MRLTVKGGEKFHLEDVKEVLGSRYSDGVAVLTEPAAK